MLPKPGTIMKIGVLPATMVHSYYKAMNGCNSEGEDVKCTLT